MSYYVPKSVLRLKDISIAMSWVIYIDTAILFFPVAHNSFLNRMLGLSYGALVRFHRCVRGRRGLALRRQRWKGGVCRAHAFGV